MKIGLDFDGVISDCGQLKSDAAKLFYGVNISPNKFKKEIVVGEKYLTLEQYRELQKRIYETRDTGLKMIPVKGALYYIPLLISEGHEILIITSRTKGLEIAKEWSSNNGLNLDFVGVDYGKSKAEAAKACEIYVDDDLDKLEPLVGIVPHRFLMSWGYNVDSKTGSVARRVNSWEELYNVIQTLL